jgi:flagellar P-ring protein precursor FlgI
VRTEEHHTLTSTFSRLALALLLLIAAATPTDARNLLKNICRVKGQEENTLHGLGLVVGLRGTGEGGEFLPTVQSLAVALDLMGNPVGQRGAMTLKDAKNVALVMVTATVPAAGGRQGDKIDCVVSSIGKAKSLKGGTLFMTPLQGPQVGSARVYAFAQGAIMLEDTATPTVGKVHGGCRLEEDFFNVFAKDGKITLVLQKDHADFQVAQDIAELINGQLNIENTDLQLAKAIDQSNIVITIPRQYLDDPVLFVSQVLSLPTLEPEPEARVVINEKAGSIVIGGDVEIGSVVVTHKSVVVETGTAIPSSRFVPVETSRVASPKLESLVKTLNAVKVPTEDIIDIIRGLERNGKLHAALIIE